MTTEPGPDSGSAPGADGAVMPLEPITREPTASVIARRLRDAIIEGTLPPGTQLTEIRLANQLGVSRAPIREALQRLIQEGLAENRRRGVFVREITSADVADVYFARTSCELAAIDRILSRPSDVPEELFEGILGDLERAAAAGDWKAAARADRRFHEVLVDAARSPRLTRMFNTLMAETAICLRALEGVYNDFLQLVDEHRAIVEALQSGDRDAVVLAVKAHMEDAVERLTHDSGAQSAP